MFRFVLIVESRLGSIFDRWPMTLFTIES